MTQTKSSPLPTLEERAVKEFVMAEAAVNRSAQTSTRAVKKHAGGTGDPAVQPTATPQHIPARRLGPRFAIRAAWEAPVDPTIAPTQANGRILPPAHPYGANAEFGDGSLLGKYI